MKNKLPLHFASAILFCASMPTVYAATYTWDGGGTAAGWNSIENWLGDPSPLTFGNTTDIVMTGSVRATNQLGTADRTIKSLTFDAGADTAMTIRTRSSGGPSDLGRTLTFSADTGNATITVDTGVTANHQVVGGSVTLTTDPLVNGGSIVLSSTLDVVHNGGGGTPTTLTLGQNGSGGTETAITGPGGINKSGTGTLTLSGPNTYTGLTDVQAGTLTFGANNVIADTASVKVSGGTLTIGAKNDTIAGLQLTSGTISGTEGILTSTSNFDMQSGTVSAILAGSVALNKTTTGTVALTKANTYTGGTNITAGRLDLNNSGAAGSGAITLADTDASSDGQLRLGSGVTVSNSLTVSDTGDLKDLGFYSSTPSTYAGAISIEEATAGNFSVSVSGSNTLTISGNISGSTAAGVKKALSGTLILSGNNSYSGETNVSNGTLKIGSATAIPSGTGKGIVNIPAAAAPGTFDLNDNSIEIGGLSGSAANPSGTPATFPGQVLNSVSGTKTLTVNNTSATTYTYSGLIKDNSGTGGTVAFRKIGTGIQNLSGANTFTGGVNIENGSLELGNSSAAGPASNTITMSAPDTEGAFSDLRFLGSATLTISNPLVISDVGQIKRLRKFGAGTAVYSGTITISETTEGLFDIQVGVTNNPAPNPPTPNVLTITGNITDTGTAGIKKINGGTLILQGAKSYTGPTSVTGGTLTLDTAFLADASSVKIGSGAFLNLTHTSTDTVDKLFINGAQKPAGVYTAVGNAGPGETAIPEITGTGKLQVTSSPAASPYQQWAGTGVSFTADANGDGISNGLAFLLGATGPNAALALPAPVKVAGGLKLTFSTPAAPGTASLLLLHSGDLGMSDAWTPVTVPAAAGITTVGGITFTVTAGTPNNTVEAVISDSQAIAGKLFSRFGANQ